MDQIKEPFVFDYLKPSSDWFETIKITINPEDYLYFRIERRYGPSWWLIGMKPVEKPKYRWEDIQIAEIGEGTLGRFIQWAKSGRGSRITRIQAIGAEFDIIEEIMRITASNESRITP